MPLCAEECRRVRGFLVLIFSGIRVCGVSVFVNGARILTLWRRLNFDPLHGRVVG
jgi:hypothetical protein